VSAPHDASWAIVKLRPEGSEAARYSGERFPAPDGWIAARAQWRYGRMDAGYMVFEPGDYLDEYFALERPYNAFALFRATGDFVGWYCNVTYPTRVTDHTITWHDLYVDVIVYPDGRTLVLDEDELAESELLERDPALHAEILAARDELLELAAANAYPFSDLHVTPKDTSP
jgi:hypothetical protein